MAYYGLIKINYGLIKITLNIFLKYLKRALSWLIYIHSTLNLFTTVIKINL